MKVTSLKVFMHSAFIVPVGIAVSVTEDDLDVLLNNFYNILLN
jgi:hypothetical protein